MRVVGQEGANIFLRYSRCRYIRIQMCVIDSWQTPPDESEVEQFAKFGCGKSQSRSDKHVQS